MTSILVSLAKTNTPIKYMGCLDGYLTSATLEGTSLMRSLFKPLAWALRPQREALQQLAWPAWQRLPALLV